jgi:hypothetical protein
MAEQAERQRPDIVDLWRQWLTESERQLNAFASDAMGSEAFARAVGGYMETSAALQRLLADGMQRYLSFVNMPSRSDVIALGETLRTIENRLARIEETLQIAAEAVDASAREEARAHEPLRTRRPPGFLLPEEDGAAAAIPEELRR